MTCTLLRKRNDNDDDDGYDKDIIDDNQFYKDL